MSLSGVSYYIITLVCSYYYSRVSSRVLSLFFFLLNFSGRVIDASDDLIIHGFVPGFEEAVADFYLSLLGDIALQCPLNGGDASSSGCSSDLIINFLDFSTGAGRCISRSDSLSLRISSIEERLGIYHVAVWGVRADTIPSTFAACCSDILGWSLSVWDFTVVHRLDARRTEFLLSVSSLALTRQILLKAADFQLRGFFVEICLHVCGCWS